MEQIEQKKRIFSGVQPSGNLTIGNYLGAIKNWIPLQEEYECLYCVVDLHTLTVRQKPAELRQRSLNLLALYMACGLDPKKSILFLQSHVSAHAELAWILNCFTYMGELNRMTQFKDKSQRHGDNINAGLFTYPVLMAADILLYQADLVPIGQDQKQHLEITRDVADRFNNIYGDTFTIPEAFIPKIGAKIMSLQEPEKKMSKSDENENAFVLILDSQDAVMRKFKRAVTDSEREIRYDEQNKPGVSNLISIYSSVTGKSISDIEKEFEGRSYGDLKETVGQSVADMLVPIQQRFNEFSSDKEQLNSILKENAEKAAYMARKTLSKVQRKIGLLPRG
ncbi:tryptophanyl-tRNA synthetase [Ruminiclostridium papyrosolvens DSM 2782]|uniref:Tryptophan--tRNA ligase n=1 Tax=Ruminiclostridium papyrosolvens DSM 2782 TaxID=588581 RepID=F1T9I7_9FIRM|nr:tryptophan--tRNA ligase [Ruminiclostridium papyrosolvens]EGD49169.1 tryptophanyl-tRNA synthetase [Ruminiclostridium papyrosolvens DSM 2782]WES35649.1 tryptophan--tRNA ligase [Ruminiclostridium papyrosolvens DSM 2782]